MCEQVRSMQEDAGLFYSAAYDPDAWFKVGKHTIYWPAHLMYDRVKTFETRGIVSYVMRDGVKVVIKADADVHHQIILCGLSLVRQLVAG